MGNLMKKFLRLLTPLSLTFILAIIPGVKIYDNTKDYSSLNNADIKVIIINDETEDEVVLDYDIMKQNTKQIYTKKDGNSLEVGYNIFIPLGKLSDKILTFTSTSTGGYQNSGGVTAKLYVYYDVSSNNEKVRLNKV